MTYFDTDVLVHYFVGYDLPKQQQAREAIQKAVDDKTFFVSLLCVQELSFAMTKLQQSLITINAAVHQLLLTTTVNYTLDNFNRAVQLAQHIGFKHINDCLHTAIAESQNCTELVTFNRKQFEPISKLTSLTITILRSETTEGS